MSQPCNDSLPRKGIPVNTNISFRIGRIPRQEKFIASFKRGWRSQWSYYRKDGKFREFDSWNDAYAFLLEKCHGNAAFLSLHFCGADPLPERETPVTPDKDLFGALCDAYARIKDSLDPQQSFYYLRGTLAQWCIDHNESIFELENLFMDDIHYISRQER